MDETLATPAVVDKPLRVDEHVYIKNVALQNKRLFRVILMYTR